MDDDKKVERLPVKHREQTKGRVLEIVRPKYNECQHCGQMTRISDR